MRINRSKRTIKKHYITLWITSPRQPNTGFLPPTKIYSLSNHNFVPSSKDSTSCLRPHTSITSSYLFCSKSSKQDVVAQSLICYPHFGRLISFQNVIVPLSCGISFNSALIRDDFPDPTNPQPWRVPQAWSLDHVVKGETVGSFLFLYLFLLALHLFLTFNFRNRILFHAFVKRDCLHPSFCLLAPMQISFFTAIQGFLRWVSCWKIFDDLRKTFHVLLVSKNFLLGALQPVNLQTATGR